MPRHHIYIRDEFDKKIRNTIQLELQNGSTKEESNYSALCNELIRLGFMIYKPKGETEVKLNLEEFRRDLIRKVSGTREGMMLLFYMVSELYINNLPNKDGQSLEDAISNYLTSVNEAEDAAEAKHFITEE